MTFPAFVSRFVAAIAVCLMVALPASAKKGDILSFDPPGSITTVALGINDAGTIVGWYWDAQYVYHGFTRDIAGNITSIDGPGAGSQKFQGTIAVSINNVGHVVGNAFGTVNAAFDRDPQGNFSSITVPTALQTYPFSINDAGEVAGSYNSTDGNAYGFLLDSSGNYSTFNPGTAGHVITVSNQQVDSSGQVGGTYYQDGGTYGFFRSAAGSITTYGGPMSSGSISPTGLSDKAIAVGYYLDANSQAHGFWRTTAGIITTLDISGANQTFVRAINVGGVMTGYYVDSSGVGHGFVRDQFGNLTFFDDPNAGSGGTKPWAINRSGQIAGTFIGPHAQEHGFLRK